MATTNLLCETAPWTMHFSTSSSSPANPTPKPLRKLKICSIIRSQGLSYIKSQLVSWHDASCAPPSARAPPMKGCTPINSNTTTTKPGPTAKTAIPHTSSYSPPRPRRQQPQTLKKSALANAASPSAMFPATIPAKTATIPATKSATSAMPLIPPRHPTATSGSNSGKKAATLSATPATRRTIAARPLPLREGGRGLGKTPPARIPATSPAKTAKPAAPPAPRHPSIQAHILWQPGTDYKNGKKSATIPATKSAISPATSPATRGKVAAGRGGSASPSVLGLAIAPPRWIQFTARHNNVLH